MSVDSCFPNPASVLYADPFGVDSHKRSDGVVNGIWLISALALTIIGALSIQGTIPMGFTPGTIMTGVGGFGLLVFVGTGCISSVYRGACILGSTLTHQN